MIFEHKPVLLDECIENLNVKPNGIYIDGTVGGAGHSTEILKRLDGRGLLIGFDQDDNAIEAATKRLSEYGRQLDIDCIKDVYTNTKEKERQITKEKFSEAEAEEEQITKDKIVKEKSTKEEIPNFLVVKTNFENIKEVLNRIGITGVNGILLDIGVSSHQLDEAERGFSYIQDAPLDMRMNTESDFSALNVINEYSEVELRKILRDYGEEKWAARIAEFIVKFRKEKAVTRTGELTEIIKAAIPKGARDEHSHPAKRTFQAVRIEVNRELRVLERVIDDGIPFLNLGGRLCIITFHSLEDRIVKNKFSDLAKACVCPREFPVCICKKVQTVKIISKKPIIASDIELSDNSRAKSAKLRVVEKLTKDKD